MPEPRATGYVRTQVRTDGVGILTLDRPDKLNALTGTMFADLERALRELGSTPGCRVVVLCGAGRAFCAGMDLRVGLVQDTGDRMAASYAAMRRAVSAVTAIREIPQPVIAAVQGYAVGAGFALAAAADIRLAAADARFDAVFVKLGMSAGDLGLSWLLPRLIGPGHAAELFYTGGALTASRAEHLGLVQAVVSDPLTEALTLAATIASMPPMGVQLTKELLDASNSSGGFREHLELELRSQVIGLNTVEHTDAVAGFPAGRRPAHPA
jgi:enoyl-CoA hydratase